MRRYSHPARLLGAGAPSSDHRRTLDAIPFVLGTGAPWRALPAEYGPWESAYTRLARYRREGTFARVNALPREGLRARGVIDGAVWRADATVVPGLRSRRGRSPRRRWRFSRRRRKGARTTVATTGSEPAGHGLAYSHRPADRAAV